MDTFRAGQRVRVLSNPFGADASGGKQYINDSATILKKDNNYSIESYLVVHARNGKVFVYPAINLKPIDTTKEWFYNA